MQSQSLAFAAATISSACGAASTSFHRPLLAPLPTLSSQPSPRRQPQLCKYSSQSRQNSSLHRDSPSPDPPSHSHDSNNRSLANLHELTERIADLLQVGSLNKNYIHCPKDAPLGYLSANTHVVIIFGKHLIRDQVTVEYAKRIITLIKQIASNSLNPDIICFTGGKGYRDRSSISEAAAGYSFFRAICEEVNLDVSRFQFILEERSHNTKENLRNVMDELRSRSGSDAVSACHFSLVSSDYHLIRIQEIHRLSPRQSMLFPLEVSSATWNCVFAAYPFCVSRDAATAFLGRAVVLANDLGILHVNLKGAIDDREFVSRENLHRLNETFAKMREMYRVIDARTVGDGGFQSDMRSHAETLELAIHNVREVQTLLNPLLNDLGSSVPRADLELARKLLETTISTMRSSMDPDRVLRVHDRLAIIEDMTHFMHHEGRHVSTALPLSIPSTDNTVSRSDTIRDATDNSYQSEFDESDCSDDEARQSRMRNRVMSNEVTWKGGAMFEGNGKRIALDGPNVVITDSRAPPVFSSTPPKKRSQSRRVTTRPEDEGTSGGNGLSNSHSISKGTSRSIPPNGTGRGRSAARKTRQTSASVKKRKSSTSRKLTAPSVGDSP